MSVHPITAIDAIARLNGFSTIIDARSEDEWAEDHLPHAVNWPSLHNDERARIGTLYKQVSPLEARKLGAAWVARNIAGHIERDVLGKPKNWQPLVYCWRGGQRSNALAYVLGQIGFRVHLLEGGYKAFRNTLLLDLPHHVQRLSFHIICGPTGSGKTRLLSALDEAGAQVLDLEALAKHRSSVLGALPGQTQPSQKHFDTLVWDRLRHFDAARPVFVEAESKKVGNVSVPDSLMTAMRASPCIRLDLADDQRVALLLEDYAFFTSDAEHFCHRLDALVQLRGKAVVEGWKAQVHAGDFEPVVRDLLRSHYDPGYTNSTQRNFTQFALAEPLVARDRSMASMRALAHALVDKTAPTSHPPPSRVAVEQFQRDAPT